MSNHKSRLDTIRVLLSGSREIGNAGPYSLILSELNSVMTASMISDDRKRRLLQILYSTRALDTVLITFIRERCEFLTVAITPDPGKGMGDYLKWLERNNINGVAKMPGTSREAFMRRIVDKRNRYMHQAGAFPRDDAEVAQLLSEMEACISQVVAL
jgi:hypothetical protein